MLLSIVFYLIEPVLTHNSGWTSLPKTTHLLPVKKHEESIARKLDSTFQNIFLTLNTPALSVAIGKNDTVVWANAIGYKDIKEKKPVSLTTTFRIGSTSKAITAMGTGILLQNKKLNLTDKVKEYVPYVANKLSDISIKQLASHTSGIRNYGLCFCFPIWEYYNNDEYTHIEESVAVFNNDPLLFIPGTDFSYSTYNYTLLSAVIEGASGMTFPDFMKTYLFDPLGLKHIDFEKQSLNTTHLSKFYAVENNEYKEVSRVNNSNKWAGGGLIATPTDLVTLGNAFLNHKLYQKEIVDTLITAVTLANKTINEQRYAIGWRNTTTTAVFKDKRKINILHHAGVAHGATSVFILFPEYNVTISLLINKNHDVSDLFEFSYKLAHFFMT